MELGRAPGTEPKPDGSNSDGGSGSGDQL